MNASNRFARTALVLASTLVVGACSTAGAGPASPTSSADPTAAASAGTTFVADLEIAGRTMHIVCLGPVDTGRPTVIFEHGLGGDFSVWADVLTMVSETDRGCSYDRAGAGMSEPPPGPRTTTAQVEDLRTLLTAAGVAPPYVLVGHSSGAWNVLVHSAASPEDVAGIVLVDPRPPSASGRFLAALPPESATESDVIHQYRAGYTTWEADPTGNGERLHLTDSAMEVEETADLGAIPLIVLAAAGDEGEGGDLDPELAATFEAIWTELQEELAKRSSAGRFVAVNDSTHDMPFDRPDAIVDAIGEILGG